MAKRIFWVGFVGLCSFLGGAAGLTLAPHLERIALAQSPSREPAAVVTDVVAIADRFELVARKVSPAIVYVEARKPEEKMANGASRVVEEAGSGVITRLAGRSEYFVLTNHHVIADTPEERIMLLLADGRVLRPARVWRDAESDIAVLSLEGTGPLPTATLGDSERMRVGNWVLAIGSPFGLCQTVTHGILSARERGQISLGNTIRIKEFLQTDAAINPGSSGGPLVNLNGEVIGINTAIASPNGNNSGIAFSIPINLVKAVMQQLVEKGAVSRGYLGVQLARAIEPADAVQLGLERAQGALVEAVFPGSPAAAAGLQVGDVVLTADRLAIRNENQLINYISSLVPGTTVNVEVWRRQQRLTLTAIVADWASSQGKLR